MGDGLSNVMEHCLVAGSPTLLLGFHVVWIFLSNIVLVLLSLLLLLLLPPPPPLTLLLLWWWWHCGCGYDISRFGVLMMLSCCCLCSNSSKVRSESGV